MSKILFTDIDGTLLDSSRVVTDKNKAAIGRWIDSGNLFVLTSGRSVNAQKIVLDQFDDTDGMYMICFQGGLVYDFRNEKIIYEKLLKGEIASEILRMAAELGIHAHAYAPEGIYTPENSDTFKKYIQMTGEKSYEIQDPSQVNDKKIYKVLTASFEDEAILYELKEKIENSPFASQIDIIFSATYFLEFIPKGVSKGDGLVKMSEYLEVPIENTISVGDERNDISMIEAAGIGCSVGNGRPELKEKADYIARNDNNHSAIAEIADKFIL